VAYRGGKAVAREVVKTAGPPAKIVLVPDRSTITVGGEDLSFITVRVEDARGNLCPAANNLVRFDVQGQGTIAAVDNGDAASLESFQAKERRAFSGLALLVVRSNRGQPGSIRVGASSEGLSGAAVTLSVK